MVMRRITFPVTDSFDLIAATTKPEHAVLVSRLCVSRGSREMMDSFLIWIFRRGVWRRIRIGIFGDGWS